LAHARSDKTILTPGLVDHDGDGVGEVQAALRFAHGQSKEVVGIKLLSHVRGQAAGLTAEYKMVSRLKGHRMRGFLTLGRERKHSQAWCLRLFEVGLPVGVALDAGVFVVIQARSAHGTVLHVKAQRLNQMQLHARVGAQSDDVARVGWDFGLVEDDVEHDC